MKAADIMTSDPVCCGPGDPVLRAATIMVEADCGCVPVVEPKSGRIVGIVTDRDLALRVVGKGRGPRDVSVDEVMSRGVICCRTDDDTDRVEQFMRSHRVRRIPVVDETGCVVGIVALADLALRGPDARTPLDAEDLSQTLAAISAPRGANPVATLATH